MENAKKIVGAVAVLANVVDSAGHKSGIKAKAMELFGLLALVKQLDGVDVKAALSEIKASDEAQRGELTKAFSDKFELADKALEAKVEQGLSLAIESADPVLAAIDQGKKIAAFVGSLKKQPEAVAVAAPVELAAPSPTAGVPVQS